MSALKKTKRMLAIEKEHGRPFWQVVDRLARRGLSRAEVAEKLGYGTTYFYRLLSKHADPLEWVPAARTRRTLESRKARRGVCTPAMRSSMQRAREVCREHGVYDLHGFVGTVREHAARQGIPATTVSSRRTMGWTLSEALGYVERKADKRGFAVRRVEKERGKTIIEVLRDLAAEGMSMHAAGKALAIDPATVKYHAEQAGGPDALGFRPYAQPKDVDRSAQKAAWLKTRGRLLAHDGRTQHLNAWSEEVGINASTIAHRIDACGWSVADALTKPVRRRIGKTAA